MKTGITITLSQDVPADGDVFTVEQELLRALEHMLTIAPGATVPEPPAPYKTGPNGGYRMMRDAEHADQYTEVRVRAVVA